MAVDAKKPLLVLINPYSGTKLASKLFRTVVKPELDQRRLLYEVLETEYAGKIEIGSMTIFYTEFLTRNLFVGPAFLVPKIYIKSGSHGSIIFLGRMMARVGWGDLGLDYPISQFRIRFERFIAPKRSPVPWDFKYL